MKNLGFRSLSAKNGYRPMPNDDRYERSPPMPEDYYKVYHPRQMEEFEKEEWEKSVFPGEKAAIDQRQIRLGYKHGDIIR